MKKYSSIYKLSKLAVKKLKVLKVGIVYLFGSQVENIIHPGSDLDFGIVFVNLPLKKNLPKVYYELDCILTNESSIGPAVNFDFIFLQFSSIVLQFEVINKGKVLFEINPVFRADFEEQVIRKYLIFEPLSKEYEKVTMETFT